VTKKEKKKKERKDERKDIYYKSTLLVLAFKIRRCIHDTNTGIQDPFTDIKVFIKVIANIFVLNHGSRRSK
jgi:hypothetical protein